jgi:hypothetical protein
LEWSRCRAGCQGVELVGYGGRGLDWAIHIVMLRLSC